MTNSQIASRIAEVLSAEVYSDFYSQANLVLLNNTIITSVTGYGLINYHHVWPEVVYVLNNLTSF